jgi:hypothetical protein
VFVTGGGAFCRFSSTKVRMHPDTLEPLSMMTLEQPIDLVRADRKEITSEELLFITVAYGLSNMESFLPNPHVRHTGRMRTHSRHLGEEIDLPE